MPGKNLQLWSFMGGMKAVLKEKQCPWSFMGGMKARAGEKPARLVVHKRNESPCWGKTRARGRS